MLNRLRADSLHGGGVCRSRYPVGSRISEKSHVRSDQSWTQTRYIVKCNGFVSGGSGHFSAVLRFPCFCSGPSRGSDSSSSVPSPRSSIVFASRQRSEPTGSTSRCGRFTGRSVGSPGQRSIGTSRGRTGHFASLASEGFAGPQGSSRTTSVGIKASGSSGRTSDPSLSGHNASRSSSPQSTRSMNAEWAENNPRTALVH